MIALKLNYINYTLFVFTETLESVSDDNQRRTNQSQRKEQEYLDSYLHETLLKSECYLHLSWLNGVCVTATLHYTTAAAVSRWSELDNFAVVDSVDAAQCLNILPLLGSDKSCK